MSTPADTRTEGGSFTLTTEPVSTQQLVRYAGASGDFNRIHYDQAYALDAGLGGVIAHGMLTMGFMARAATDWGGPRSHLQAISARFTSPVRPGDRVRVTGTVRAEQARDGRRQAQCDLEAHVGEALVATGQATVLLPPD